MADYGFAKIGLKFKWCLIAIVLPLIVTGVYLLFFQGKFVPSDMNGNQIFTTLSAGIAFTGIAAGFVEEMVFRGVILNLLKERWNIVIIGGGLSIGEEADSYSVLSYVLDSKAFAITGGEFGVESSVIALIAYIVVAVFAFVMIKKKRKD